MSFLNCRRDNEIELALIHESLAALRIRRDSVPNQLMGQCPAHPLHPEGEYCMLKDALVPALYDSLYECAVVLFLLSVVAYARSPSTCLYRTGGMVDQLDLYAITKPILRYYDKKVSVLKTQVLSIKPRTLSTMHESSTVYLMCFPSLREDNSPTE